MIIPAMRGTDIHGAGYFGAPRRGRLHNGVDFVGTQAALEIAPGDAVRAFRSGTVSKLGYPYKDNMELRYVQLTDGHDHARYMYVEPTVDVGDFVQAGEMIGTLQALPYEGMTPHYHFEVKCRGDYLDPLKWMCGGYPR